MDSFINRAINLVIIFTVLSILMLVSTYIAHIAIEENKSFEMQNECIQKYVQMGIPRKDIERVEYGCKVKTKY